RGICVRCDFHQIQAGALGGRKCLLNAHDADLFPVGTDHTDPRRTDLLVAPDAFTLDDIVLLTSLGQNDCGRGVDGRTGLPKLTYGRSLKSPPRPIMHGLSGQWSILRSLGGRDKTRARGRPGRRPLPRRRLTLDPAARLTSPRPGSAR